MNSLLPLCRTHHREVHRIGDEPAWWKQAGIDPIKAARNLWESTRLNERAPSAHPTNRTECVGWHIETLMVPTSRHRRNDGRHAHRPLTVRVELFHTANGTAFADLMIDGHRETWPIRGTRFRSWLRRRYYEATGEAPTAGAIRLALNSLEARAQFDAPLRAILHARRGARRSPGSCGANEYWRAVEIGPDGCRVMTCPPVYDSAGLPASAPTTSAAGDVAWLLAALRHGGPYPLLAVSGEQGSAKTVLSKILRALVDPNAAPVRTVPREERDLFIAANNGHLLAFDNLSDIPSRTSDALCRLASGGSFAVRQLYTDDDEMLFQAARPAILNGIQDVITQPDLADRAIFLTLPYVQDTRRRPEWEIWRQFEIAQPQIFGALLEAASHGLRRLPEVHLKRLPRMADFALWATACETAFWPAGTFLRAYTANRRIAIENVIEADPVAARVRDIMANQTTWTGNASDLLRAGADAFGMTSCGRAPVGRNLPARWPAGCVAHRRRFGRSALRLPLAARGALERASFG